MTPLLAGAPQAIIREFSQQRAQRGRYVSSAAVTTGRSLRFNSADSAYLSRTPGSVGNRRTFTWSGWLKRSAFNDQEVFSVVSSTAYFIFRLQSDNTLRVNHWTSGVGDQILYISSQVFRDPSSWYHFVIAVDTTQATSTDRIKVYVNNTQITTWSYSTAPSPNLDTLVNTSNTHFIGGTGSGAFAGQYLNGYLALIHLIDGYAYDPSYFGETSATTGQWIAKTYSGTYGTNGFFLDFADNSNNTASTLGKDTSGLGNNWTPNNLTVAVSNASAYGTILSGTAQDAVDGSTSNALTGRINNFGVTLKQPVVATSKIRVYVYSESTYVYLNKSINTGQTQIYPSVGWVDVSSSVSFPFTLTDVGYQGGFIGDSAAIYAIEVDNVIINTPYESPANIDSLRDHPTSAGISTTGAGGEVSGNYCTFNPLVGRYNDSGQSGTAPTFLQGNLQVSGGQVNDRIAATWHFRVGDTGKWYWEIVFIDAPTHSNGVGVRDYSAGTSSLVLKVWYYDGSATDGGPGTAWTTNDVLGLALDTSAKTVGCYKNGTFIANMDISSLSQVTPFVQCSTGIDVVANFGQRAFAHNAPSGFSPLVDTLLPTPTIGISSTVMDVKLYTGNGSTQTISGLGFSPDLVWIKNRSHGRDNNVYDTVRGATKLLSTNSTTVDVYNGSGSEQTVSGLTAFNSDGFTVGSDNVANQNTPYTYVAWAWDAGSSNAPNNSGTIASTVRANISAGFSVVTYSGDNTTNGSVGHGLGVSPSMVIIKARNASKDWKVAHVSLAAQNMLSLNQTYATGIASWDGVTSTVFKPARSGDTYNNTSGENYVAYCFAPVAGYSAFGSYTGNGLSDGPFVYTGFRPRWVLIKASSSATYGNWLIHDTSRSISNVSDKNLYANLSNSEDGTYLMDCLSNGFKLRSSDYDGSNGSGLTYVYAAFAEAPFPYARAR